MLVAALVRLAGGRRQRWRSPRRFEYEIRGATVRGELCGRRAAGVSSHARASGSPAAAANLVEAKTIASGARNGADATRVRARLARRVGPAASVQCQSARLIWRRDRPGAMLNISIGKRPKGRRFRGRAGTAHGAKISMHTCRRRVSAGDDCRQPPAPSAGCGVSRVFPRGFGWVSPAPSESRES